VPDLVVRRTGNSLAVMLPRSLARDLGLSPGDRVRVELAKAPALEEFDGLLKGKATAAELSKLADEGEDLA